MFYTPGWGALMTAGFTLAGVIVTQQNQRIIQRQEIADKHRVEQRDVMQAVGESAAALHQNDAYTSSARRLARMLEQQQDQLPAALESFNSEKDAAYGRINQLKQAQRRAAVVVSDPLLSHELSALAVPVYRHEMNVGAIYDLLDSYNRGSRPLSATDLQSDVGIATQRALRALDDLDTMVQRAMQLTGERLRPRVRSPLALWNDRRQLERRRRSADA